MSDDALNDAAEAILDPLGHTKRVPFPKRGHAAIVHAMTVSTQQQAAADIDELVFRLLQNAETLRVAMGRFAGGDGGDEEAGESAWFQSLLGIALRIPAIAGPIGRLASKHVTWAPMTAREIAAAGDTYRPASEPPKVESLHFMAEVPTLVVAFLEVLLEPVDPSAATWADVMTKVTALVAPKKPTTQKKD